MLGFTGQRKTKESQQPEPSECHHDKGNNWRMDLPVQLRFRRQVAIGLEKP
jgi:hypothetical protein